MKLILKCPECPTSVRTETVIRGEEQVIDRAPLEAHIEAHRRQAA